MIGIFSLKVFSGGFRGHDIFCLLIFYLAAVEVTCETEYEETSDLNVLTEQNSSFPIRKCSIPFCCDKIIPYFLTRNLKPSIKWNYDAWILAVHFTVRIKCQSKETRTSNDKGELCQNLWKLFVYFFAEVDPTVAIKDH